MLAGRRDGFLACRGQDRIVAGGQHRIVAVAQHDEIVAFAGADRVIAGVLGEDRVVTFVGVDRPCAGIAAEEYDAVVAAAGYDRSGAAGGDECHVADAGEDRLTVVARAEDRRFRCAVDNRLVTMRQYRRASMRLDPFTSLATWYRRRRAVGIGRRDNGPYVHAGSD